MSWRKLEGTPAGRCDHGFHRVWACDLRQGHPGPHLTAERPRPTPLTDPIVSGLALRELARAMLIDVVRAAENRELESAEIIDHIGAGRSTKLVRDLVVPISHVAELISQFEIRVSEAITLRLEHARQRGALVAPAIGAETELESLRELLAVFLRKEGF